MYRSFESREEILLQVWIEELNELGDRLEIAFARGKDDSLASTVRVVARAFERQPLLCELMAIVAPVLERGLSPQAIVRSTRELALLTARIAGLLHARLSKLSVEDCAWAASSAAIYVAGLWESSRPSPAKDEAFAAAPELLALQPSFERDLERFLHVLFARLSRDRSGGRASNLAS